MKRDAETSYYTFDTASKFENNRSADCVVRSIALVEGKSWEEVFDELVRIARPLCRMPNEKVVYTKYLEWQGYKKYPAPRKPDNHRFTAMAFARQSKGKKIIAHVGGHHLSAFIDGKIHDIWNCGAYSVGNFWIKE